jgi:hypothetical protein
MGYGVYLGAITSTSLNTLGSALDEALATKAFRKGVGAPLPFAMVQLLMKLENLGDGSLEFGTVEQIKGQFFAGKKFQRLAADVFHYLFRLVPGIPASADFPQSQVHQKPQVPEVAVFFPNGLG